MGKFGGFYNKNDVGSEYVYGPTDTGKGGGSINTGSSGKPSDTPKEKPKTPPADRKPAKENDADHQRKLDDAFMNEPSTTRGTESGAYDGLESTEGNYWRPED